MIDLHLHLDGSLEPEFLFALSKSQHKDITLDTIKDKCICKQASSLNDYLTCFDLPLELLQTEESLQKATYHLISRLDSQGLLYAEIRFAPQLHTRQGLTIEKVVQSVISGVDMASKDFDIKVQIILCCMRGGVSNKQKNIQTIEIASRYLSKGVCAVDLAGAEALYKTKDFDYLFEIAKGVGVPFVIHAGEADGVSSVRSAVNFGASRIGHGIALKDDKALMKEVANRKIAIEMCPSSNLQTKAVSSLDNYPLREFLDNNILVTINTDNMTVSNTTISKEFKLLEDKIGLTKNEKKLLLINAVNSCFLNESDKTKLMIKVLDRLK